jgi:hypothetical protein
LGVTAGQAGGRQRANAACRPNSTWLIRPVETFAEREAGVVAAAGMRMGELHDDARDAPAAINAKLPIQRMPARFKATPAR